MTTKIDPQAPIGSEFELENKKYKVVEQNRKMTCSGCDLIHIDCVERGNEMPECNIDYRTDGKTTIFKKIE